MFERMGVQALLVINGIGLPSGDGRTGTPWWVFVYDPDSDDYFARHGDFVMGRGRLPIERLTESMRVIGYEGVLTPNLMKVGLDMTIGVMGMRRWVSALGKEEMIDWDVVYSGIGVDLGLWAYLVYWSLMGCPLGRIRGGGIRWDERGDG